MTKRKSKLAKAIEKRGRKDHGPFDLPPGFVSQPHSGETMGKVYVRVLVKAEEDAAIIAAYKMMTDMATDGAEAAMGDSDFTTDNKGVYALYKAIRDADDDPMYPAFLDQGWMREHLTTDKIAYLLNLYFSCRENEEVMKWTIDGQELERKLDDIADADPESALPRALLADCSNEWVRNAVVLCAMRLRDERRALYRTRQLLAHAVSIARSVEVTESNAGHIAAWATAASGELAADEPWGTRTVVEQGWIGLDRADYAEARNALLAIASDAAGKAPEPTPDEQSALEEELSGVADDSDEARDPAMAVPEPDGIMLDDEDS